MKNLVFGLVAMVIFSLNGFANNVKLPAEQKVQNSIITTDNSELVILKLQSDNLTASYQFSKIKDFSDYSQKMINSFISELVYEEECSITISMSVTVTAEASIGVAGGSVSTTVTGSVTTSCANAVAAGKALKKQLIAMAS